MKQKWIEKQLKDKSYTMPILSFPSIQLTNISVKDLVNNSERQAEGMKLIADRCPTSASVSMMDLSVEAEAFGSNIRFTDNEVPTVIGRIINNNTDAENLVVPKVGIKRTGIYINAIKEAKKQILDRPIFAGVIGPFSLAGRLMDMTEIMVNCYLDPEMVHTTIEKTSEFILNYILGFKDAGADGVVIAEPAAGLLSPDLCEEFSSKYIKHICSKVKDENFVVCYHNCGNTIPLLDSIINIDADVYHFGNAINIEEVLKVFPKNKLVMGNINPLLFKNNKDKLVEETLNLLNRCDKYNNFVISSGCDIPPSSNWENINVFFETIKKFYSTK